MTFPNPIVEIAFSDDPLTESPTWTDVSTYVRAFEINRGRQREIDQMEGGTATIVLDNRDRRFDPDNASSPYSPNVKPMKQVRIRELSEFDATTYPVFRGLVESWAQSYPDLKSDAVVELRCADAFKLFALSRAPTEGFRHLLLNMGPKLYWPLDDEPGDDVFLDITENPLNFGTFVGNVGASGAAGPFAGGPDTLVLTETNNDGISAGYATTVDSAKLKNAIKRSFTTVLWFRAPLPEASGSNHYLFSVDLGSFADSLAYLLEDAGAMKLGWGPRGVGAPNVTVTVNVNEWHMAVCDYDYTSGYARVRRRSASQADGDTLSNTSVPGLANPATQARAVVGALDDAGNGDGPDSRIAHVAVFDRLLTDDEVDTLDAVTFDTLVPNLTGSLIDTVLDVYGWPAGLRDTDSGIATAEYDQDTGASNLLDLLQALAHDTEDGLLFMQADGKLRFVQRHARFVNPGNTVQATFGDSGAEHRYRNIVIEFDDEEIWNRVEVQPDGGDPVLVSDATSQDSYGERTLARPTYERAVNGVMDLANGLLARYKDPFQRVTSITFFPESLENLFNEALKRELDYERIRVRRRPPGGGSAIEEELFISGIQHSVSASPRSWVTTWYLSPASEGIGQPWLLGDATFGVLNTTTKLGY